MPKCCNRLIEPIQSVARLLLPNQEKPVVTTGPREGYLLCRQGGGDGGQPDTKFQRLFVLAACACQVVVVVSQNAQAVVALGQFLLIPENVGELSHEFA